jgi:hypothetical protein
LFYFLDFSGQCLCMLGHFCCCPGDRTRPPTSSWLSLAAARPAAARPGPWGQCSAVQCTAVQCESNVYASGKACGWLVTRSRRARDSMEWPPD